MAVEQLFNEYFIKPIISHSGYNPVNTITYAIIAVASAYLIYKLFRSVGARFDKNFIMRVVPYVLLGSTVRVVTDSIDTGVMQSYEGFFKGIYEAIINSGIYNYGFATASPGIYIIIGLFALITLYYSYKSKKYDWGPILALGLFALHLLILIPMFANAVFMLLILVLAGAIGYAYYLAKKRSNVAAHWLVVFSQALDGSATFITLDVFNSIMGKTYVEQHVLANALAGMFGGSMLAFLILKVALAVVIVWILEKEDNAEERNYIALLIIIFGLAPGVRDLLRLTVGA